MAAFFIIGLAANSLRSVPKTCGASRVEIDSSYASDHHNYLCNNYTRPVPLPCVPASSKWKPLWFGNASERAAAPKKFMIYAWWPPNPADFEAYADAGFDLAMSENAIAAYCSRRGANATVTHDDLLDAHIATSDALAKLGLLTTMATGNGCNEWLKIGPTVAYGNATGGVIEAMTNITARGHEGAPTLGLGQPVYSKGTTVRADLLAPTIPSTATATAERYAERPPV